MCAPALNACLVAAMALAQANAQGEPASPPGPASAASGPSAKQRLENDLAHVCEQLRQQPHTFRGRLQFGSLPPGELPEEFEHAFVGGCRDGLSWFEMADWRVVTRGERTAVARGDRAWTKPQGDGPEVPLTPRLFAGLLAAAELGEPEPTDYDDRPAVRVHARWRGEAAKQTIWTTSVSSNGGERLLQAIATVAARGEPTAVVDAMLRYDPATKVWLATTLRIALVDGRPLPVDEPPIPAVDGLPSLTGEPMVHVLIRLGRCPAEQAPLPELDADASRILGLPTAGRAK